MLIMSKKKQKVKERGELKMYVDFFRWKGDFSGRGGIMG